MRLRPTPETKTTMTLLLALILIYAGHMIFKIVATEVKRKNLRVGDSCKVYIGEQKIDGLILKINHEIEIWVSNKVVQATRNQIYL